MLRILSAVLIALVVVAATVDAHRGATKKRPRLRQILDGSDRPLSYPRLPLRSASTVVDTFVLGSWGFDSGGAPDAQGWRTIDLTAQEDLYTHIASGDDELQGGTFGTLFPIQGNQSLYCGAGADYNEYTCDYATPPGSGGNWEQYWVSRPFVRSGEVTLSYYMHYDTEPGYDHVGVYYRDGADPWTQLRFFDGNSGGPFLESFVFPDSSLSDTIQFMFHFTGEAAWNDENGLWPTDGAYMVDSLTVTDATGTLDYEDFEDEPARATATNDGDWWAVVPPSYGDVSGLYSGLVVKQDDPCFANPSYVWGFLEGSTLTYNCNGDLSSQLTVPGPVSKSNVCCDSPELYLNSQIESPYMDWDTDVYGVPIPASASRVQLEFDLYEDMPLDGLVVYQWAWRSVFDGCPDNWTAPSVFFYGDSRTWRRMSVPIFPDPGADAMQVALRVIDVCAWYRNSFGTCTCVTHGPLFDNVRVVRLDTQGPQWLVDPENLFQDNFATDGSKTGTVRMDAALDIMPYWLPNIDPGDSVAVTVREPTFGLDDHAGPGGGPAVYLHVKDVSPAKSGAAISGDAARWPLASAGGGWTVLRADSCRTASGTTLGDAFCFDLNDSMYTPGDVVEYYFSARDGNGRTTYWTQSAGVTDLPAALDLPNEVTCLPTGSSDVLHVDVADGTGVQPYFDATFSALGVVADRYDVLGPTTGSSNGLASRVKSLTQLTDCYKKIIWSTGALGADVLADTKAFDYALLHDFLDTHSDKPGVYLTGDDIGASVSSGAAPGLFNNYLRFTLVDDNHRDAGLSTSPLALGVPGGCFDDAFGPDTTIAYGGCPVLTSFDVMSPAGSSVLEMTYDGNAAFGAVVSQTTANTAGDTARALIAGFSFDRIRDDRLAQPIDRVDHLDAVLRWLQCEPRIPVAVPKGRFENRLVQNHPNPFNPSTRIEYAIRDAGVVTLRVYNTRGQLIRTLVDEARSPQTDGFVATWDGRNDRGDAVATGVYFYRLTAPGFTQTKKMVLLK